MGLFNKNRSALANLKFANQEGRRVLDNPESTKKQRENAAADIKEAYEALIQKGLIMPAEQFHHTFIAHYADEIKDDPGIPVKLTYRKNDPLALSISFEEFEVEREYFVARSLIAVVLGGSSAGEGDVRIEQRVMPGCGCRGIRFRFIETYGWRNFTLHLGEVYTVVEASYLMVPKHRESACINIDSFIDEVLKG